MVMMKSFKQSDRDLVREAYVEDEYGIYTSECYKGNECVTCYNEIDESWTIHVTDSDLLSWMYNKLTYGVDDRIEKALEPIEQELDSINNYIGG
jgi:hypothetical protein